MKNTNSILITGGTGTFGKAFVKYVLKSYPEVSRIVVYSRDELKQFEMSNDKLIKENQSKLRFFIGDIRDAERLKRACEGIDIVVHAAAMKQVVASEYNPFECIKTNIIGAQNLIDAVMDTGVKKVVALSTDKAAAPINLYGATKLCSDKLFVAANNMTGNRDLKFSVVRYGNVMGSRGSVIPFFQAKKAEGVLPITDKNMTRFNITIEDAVKLVEFSLENMWGGEIFVPKIPSYRILDLAKAICPDCTLEYVGIRPGEKVHEEMITSTDSYNAVEFERYFTIVPQMPLWNLDEYINTFGGKKLEKGSMYNSGKNTEWLSVEDLKVMIKDLSTKNL